MSSEQRLLDLLVQWEEQRQIGKPPIPEELCRDDPALLSEFRRRLARRQRLLSQIEPAAARLEKPSEPGPNGSIGGYELLEMLGHGGMGVVYRAHQPGLNRIVALKCILYGMGSSPQERERFRMEAEAVARLQHPNIVQIYEVGEENGQPYLILEYVGGGTLAQHLNGKPLAPRAAAELVRTLARATQHAHERGIVHRDLKPANILIHRGNTESTPTSGGILPKIADFGLAKRLDDAGGMTRTGAVVGTPNYMAPEQAAGRKDVGPLADVYALGAILYECLTGRPPFLGESVLETLEQVREHLPRAPSALQAHIPHDLEVLCLKCLEKEPAQRYANAGALAQDLEAFMEGEPIKAAPPTLINRVSWALRRDATHPNFRTWSPTMVALSPVPITTHLIATAIYQSQEDYPRRIAWTMMTVITLVQVGIFSANWASLRMVPTAQFRRLLTVWVTNTIGCLLILLILLRMVPEHESEPLYYVYHCWLVLLGLGYYSFAADAGGFYVYGSICFLFAFALIFIPTWAPLLVSLFSSVNMAIQGVLIRWAGRHSVG